MFKYIARQVEPGTEDFGWVFDDDGLTPSSGDFNNTLFIFDGNDCRFNGDIYSDYEFAIDGLSDAFEHLNDFDYTGSFKNHLDFVEDMGFGTDDATIRCLDSCVRCADKFDYPTALAYYLQAKTGKTWGCQDYHGYSQGDYCTLVYCADNYEPATVNYYGKMWLGCGGEFDIGELEIPNVYADDIDFSDLDSFESWVDDWTCGYFVVDDIIWRGGDKLISELSDYADCSKEDLEVYVYEDGTYVNAKDM
jgi:hypothetical protein